MPDSRQWNIWVTVNAVIRFLLSLEPENERRHAEELTGKVIALCWEVGSITLYAYPRSVSFPWATLISKVAPHGAPKNAERETQTSKQTQRMAVWLCESWLFNRSSCKENDLGHHKWCCLWCVWQMQQWHLIFSHSSFSPAGGHWRQRKGKHLNVGFKPACLTPFINVLTQSDLSLCDASIIWNGKSKYGGLQYSVEDREHSLGLAKSCLNAADSWRGKRKSFTDTSNVKKDKWKIMFLIIHSVRIQNRA